jgi:exodeoxyribonuclease V alpha subunit
METIEGIIEEIIYTNEDNGYTVFSITCDEGQVTCVGTLFKVTIGEGIKVVGEYTSHHIYGMQFKVEQFWTFLPHEITSMERYLGSGAIKGIGPSLAKKIIERFGNDSFRVIEEEPNLLEEIKGISIKKAQSIAKIFSEQRNMRNAIIFLQDFSISLTYAIKIYNEYKEKTFEIIKNNPYQLAEDINGIGFKVADSIANKLGIDKLSPQRIMSGIKYILYQNSINGHVYMEKETLLETTIQLLDIEKISIDNVLLELQIKNQIVVKKEHADEIVYLSIYYNMEQYVAQKIYELSTVQIKPYNNINKEMEEIEKTDNIKLDIKQKKAIKVAMDTGVLIITGGPGTGKTTTINTIISFFEQRGMEVLLAAPTGRAAKRMAETTSRKSKTIHRLLEICYSKDELHQKFERNEEYPLEGDVVIVDETSMIDITLMYHLLKAIVKGTRLILVGDKDQLPSVGPGNVLKDLINCSKINTVILDKIFRQSEESHIVLNAHKINSGQKINLKNDSKDFFFINRSNPNNIINEIISLVKTRLPKFTKQSSYEGIQVLTPMRKGYLGVENLNIELQKELNPASNNKNQKEYRQTIFREGDKIMQVRNNYNIEWKIISKYNFTIDEGLGVFNGDIGRIESINNYTEKVRVKFDDDKVVDYEFSNLDELELAYAVTIHKSQGSEYPVVVMPIFSGPPMLLNKNLLYTAVTRAKDFVVMVGIDSMIDKMVQNDRDINRNSTLGTRIIEIYERCDLLQ